MSYMFEEFARIENFNLNSSLAAEASSGAKQRAMAACASDQVQANCGSMESIIRSFKLRQRGNSFAIIGTESGAGSTTLAIQVAYLLAGPPYTHFGYLAGPKEHPEGNNMAGLIDVPAPEISQFFTTDFTSIFKTGTIQRIIDNLRGSREDQLRATPISTKSGSKNQTSVLPILLIDANWHHPDLDRKLAIPRKPGFIELMNGTVEWHQVLYPIPETPIWVIPTGDLDGKRYVLGNCQIYKEMLNRIRTHFNYVIIDSCPIMAHMTTLSMASVVDGVIMVLRAGHTRWENARNAKQRLLTARANILGVTINPYSEKM